MSDITKGSNNGMYGRKHTKESKDKMSKNSIGKTACSKNGMYNKKDEFAINGKKVSAYNEDGSLAYSFPSKKMALQFLNIKNHKKLNEAIKNKTLYKGYY